MRFTYWVSLSLSIPYQNRRVSETNFLRFSHFDDCKVVAKFANTVNLAIALSYELIIKADWISELKKYYVAY